MEFIEIYEEVLNLKKSGQSFALATVIESGGSTPRKVGSKMVVRPDGTIVGTIGGGPLEHEVAKKAVECIKTGICEKVSFELSDLTLTCGGNVVVFIEPHIYSGRAVIFGGGHIAAKLAPLLQSSDFFVTVIDDRPEYIEPSRFPDCERILIKGYEAADLLESKAAIALKPSDYVVIVTRGHEYSDGKVLDFVLGQLNEFKYVGMIGSRNKVATAMKSLIEKGHAENKLKQVYAPIGLDIGGETPAEISIAISAEILSVKYSKDGKNVRTKKGFFSSKS